MQLRRITRILNMNKIIKGTMVVDMRASLTTGVEDMEVEVDSLGIATTNHVGPSNVSCATKKATDMQNVHTRTELI